MNQENGRLKTFAFIPARYASTRLPGKPLIDICGKPLLQRVWENVIMAETIDRVIVATDDERIASLCRDIGADCAMTPPELASGSDRIAYAYNSLGEEASIILNIQGDEPFLSPEVIDKLVIDFSAHPADAGTLVKIIDSYDELNDPGVVKVVLDNNNFALYFSRSIIPFVRDVNKNDWLSGHDFYKHIGVYAYTTATLIKFVGLNPSELESAEKLEQLRLLQNGFRIRCVETGIDLIGIDTPGDVDKAVKRIISAS